MWHNTSQSHTHAFEKRAWGGGSAVVAVVLIVKRYSSDYSELERKHLEKTGMLNFIKKQELTTRAQGLREGREPVLGLGLG